MEGAFVGLPLISICVPLFNKAATVETALRTVMACREFPLEIAVFDNGSTDGSGEIVARLAREDDRIRLVRLDHTIMIQESWRMALLHGRGELLKLQSADDELDPQFLPAMLEPLQRSPGLGYTMCIEKVDERRLPAPIPKIHAMFADVNVSCRRIAAAKTVAERARLLVTQATLENFLGNIYKVVMRRECLPLARWKLVTRAYPMPTSYPDWDFLVRLMLHHEGEFVERELSRYIITPESPVARLAGDTTLRLADAFQRVLQVLTVLGDPQLGALRGACTAEELQMLANQVGVRIENLVALAMSIPPNRP
ncbi:MAG TPA: glycosyltransferase family A protein [Phycisphaerae bacterium]|nr:glycosyltransferase family A protein [Phycisphaerae bacterium]